MPDSARRREYCREHKHWIHCDTNINPDDTTEGYVPSHASPRLPNKGRGLNPTLYGWDLAF